MPPARLNNAFQIRAPNEKCPRGFLFKRNLKDWRGKGIIELYSFHWVGLSINFTITILKDILNSFKVLGVTFKLLNNSKGFYWILREYLVYYNAFCRRLRPMRITVKTLETICDFIILSLFVIKQMCLKCVKYLITNLKQLRHLYIQKYFQYFLTAKLKLYILYTTSVLNWTR